MEPQPGEVWIITESRYGEEGWEVIRPSDRPFIVTAITPGQVQWVHAHDDGSAYTGAYERGKWDWGKHAARVWPPLPSWDELERQGQCPDDLRARTLAGTT